MKSKKLVALSLAVLLATSPVSNVYAAGLEGIDPGMSENSPDRDRTEIDQGFSQIPEDDRIDSGFSQHGDDGLLDSGMSQVMPTINKDPEDSGFSQLTEDEKIDPDFTQNPLDPDGKIVFNHSMKDADSGWNSESSDISILFDFKFGAKKAEVYYTLAGEEEQKIEVPVSKNDDEQYIAEIKKEDLKDGVYTITAICSGADTSVSNVLKVKIDATGVSFDSVTASNLTVIGDTGYFKDSFTLSGFSDNGSGVEKIVVSNKDWSTVEFTGSNPVSVSKDSQIITAVDKAGNSTSIALADLLKDRNICQNLAVDPDSPELSVQVSEDGRVEVNGNVYYTSDVSLTVSASDTTLKSVSVSKNDSLLENINVENGKAEKVFTFTGDGEYNIHVVATDSLGSTSESSVKFSIDSTAPSKGSVKATGNWVENADSLHTSGTITIDGVPTDSISGVKSVSVLKGADTVATSLPYEITESGEYSVELIDNVGNKSVLSLSDLTGTSATKVVVDKELPNVSIDKEKTSKPVATDERGMWYSSNPTIVFSATDNNIKSVTVTADVDGSVSTLYSGTTSLSEYKISTSSLSGKNFKITVTAEDYSGNSSKDEISYFVDSTPPTLLDITSDEPSNEKGGNVYFNKPFSITVKAEDDAFGSITYYLNVQSNSTGSFSGLGTGTYSVKVADGLGSATTLTPIGDMCGWGSSRVVVNGDAPVVSMNKQNSVWLANPMEYKFNVESAVGVDRVLITVNGTTVVDEHYDSIDVTEKEFSVDLSTLKADEKFAYNTKITVTDNSGLTTVESDTVYVDTVKPDKGSLVAEGTVNLKDDKLYTNGTISLKGTPVDSESGIDTISVLKDGDVVGSIPYTIAESGTYSVKVVDKVGNQSIFGLSELIGKGSSTVVVDKSVPVVDFDMSKSTSPSYISKDTIWFYSNPSICVKMSDDNLDTISIKVDVDGSVSEVFKDISENGEYIVNTKAMSGKSFNIIATAKDKSGNVTESNYKFYVDLDAPTIGDMRVSGKWNEDNGKMYTNGIISIEGNPLDSDSGIKSVDVLRDEESVGFIPYKIASSGSYSVKVTDNVGRVSVFSLADIAKTSTSEVVFDADVPTVYFDMDQTDKPQYVDDTKYWYASNPTVVVGMTDANIDKVKVVCSVDGNETVVVSEVSPDGVYKVNTGYIEGKYFKITATITDKSGNTSSDSYEFYVDSKSPDVGSIEARGDWNLNGGKLYINSPIRLVGSPEDEDSGIKSIEVLKDDDFVSSLPYDINSSGVYSVRVTDNVGNVSVFKLSDIANVPTSTVVWDTTLPSVVFDVEKSDAPKYVVDGVAWYDGNPTMYVSMNDENLSSVNVMCYVDGVATTLVSKENDSGVYKIDTSYTTGREFKIVATAVDKSGNKGWFSYTFYVDYNAPEVDTLSASANPEWLEVDGYVYSRGSFVFSGKPMDNDSGVKSVTLYKDDVVVEDFGNKSVYKILNEEGMSGRYYFILEDNVGHKKTVQISELLGSKSSDLVVDLTNPVISRTDSNKESVDGWYSYVPTFTYDVSDDNISKYSVVVNGKEVLSGNKSEEITLNTEEFQNQVVDILVTVADKAGNESTYSYKYSQDNTPPSNVVVSAPSPVSFKGENVYFNGQVDLKITAEDNFYGNLEYYINGELVKNGEYTITESGEYSFEVKDGLGNSSGVISLKDYFGWSGNNIVIDVNAPAVESNKYSGSWITGVGTYNIVVKDDLGIDNIIVSINGKEVINNTIEGTTSTKETVTVDTTMATPNEDGSFDVVVRAYDNSKLSAVWSDKVFVDNTAPSVSEFKFDGFVNSLNSDGYVYFFNGDGTISISSVDAGYSSGLASLWTRFEGADWVETPIGEDGVVTLNIPANFKGSIEAYAVDRVGLKSDTKTSVKVISETAETHNSNSSIGIKLPETPYRDANGTPLYNGSLVAGMGATSKWSGIKSIVWGIDTLSSITDFSSGEKELNITTGYSQDIALDGNANGLNVTAVMTDMSGFATQTNAVFSIDKDAPVISVVYHSNEPNGHYKDGRSATIYIKERNFDPSLVTIGGKFGDLGQWVHDGDTWSCNVSFSEDADYAFTIDCKDLANNSAVQYVSENFTVDKTNPQISVSWNTDGNANNFYNESRVATITVTERNFDGSLVNVVGGDVSGWSSNGDSHTAVVRFDSSGEYELSVSCSDRAGNKSTDTYSSGKFIVDLDKPVIEILGVSNGVSYKGAVEFIVKVSDTYINNDTYVTLLGKNHEEVNVTGQIVGQSGTFSFSNFPESEDVDDIYTLKVVAKDNAGNITEQSVVFSVNRFGSSYKFYNEKLLGNYLNAPEDVEISEMNVDKLDTSKVSVIVTRDGKEIELKDSWVTITEKEVDSKYFYTYRISKEAFEEDGKYSVSIISQAMEGTKYTSVAEQYDFVIDRTPPEVIISGVQSGEVYHEYKKTVTIDTRDLSGIGYISILLNGVEVEDYSESEGIYTFNVGESEENQNILVTVRDMAGNETTTSVDDFLLTSNTMIYLVNQTWFMIVIATIAFLIIVLLLMLFSNRRKDKDDEREAMLASGELYRSSTSSSTSGTNGSATVASDETSVLEDKSDDTPTGLLDE